MNKNLLLNKTAFLKNYVVLLYSRGIYPGTYGTFYTDNSLEECLKKNKNEEFCVLKTSYELTYSLGPNYIKTEQVLCNKLSEKEKKYCYFSIGKRIGEIHFLNITRGIEECGNLPSEYSSYCFQGVCSIKYVFGAEDSLNLCKS